MTHIWADMFEMAETFTKHMFHYVPDMPFEVTDDMGLVLNGGTDWHRVPLHDGKHYAVFLA